MFSARFDAEYLKELYDNDMDTIMEMFGTSIEAIRAEMARSNSHHQHGDIESLRRVFHKMKPVFGYVGLNSLQEYVHDFENKCSMAPRVEMISRDYELLVSMVSDAVALLEQELKRMKTFTNLKVS
jgi:HPt (histidine-containing phosphotransfer) domain-containing protein